MRNSLNAVFNERAKRAADSSPGWSEAKLWVTAAKIKARFSGRLAPPKEFLCRPLKRAHVLFLHRYPGLRYACPGLNSSAGYAGSLNSFIFNLSVQTSVQAFLGSIPEGGFQRV